MDIIIVRDIIALVYKPRAIHMSGSQA
nr:unnamed protein product [Callosobruchus chinensis]